MKISSIKISTTRILIILFFLFLALNINAQGPPPPPGSGPNGTGVNDQVPITSFLAIGLIAGAVYGIRKSK